MNQNGIEAAVHQIGSSLCLFLLNASMASCNLMTGGPAHDGAAVGYGVTFGENADDSMEILVAP